MRSSFSKASRKDIKYGVAVLDVDRDVIHDREYQVWIDMVKRCYGNRHPSYLSCSVSDEFLLYSVFHSWLSERWVPNGSIDKDIKIRGNKIYSPATCLVVSMPVNKAFQLKKHDGMPHGVKSRPRGRFAAYQFNLDGSTSSRNFLTKEDAHKAWQISKAAWIEFLSVGESNESRPFIIDRVRLLREDAAAGIETGDYL